MSVLSAGLLTRIYQLLQLLCYRPPKSSCSGASLKHAACLLVWQVVGDKASIKESLRLLTCALALSKADDAQNMEAIKLAAMKPHAVQVRGW